MTREEFEKSPDHDNMKFIGENRQSTKVFYNEEEKELYCRVSKDEDIKEYEMNYYLKMLGIYTGLKATDEKSEIKQMEILVEARSALIHLIENTKRMSIGLELKHKYKYAGFVKSIDSHILMSKMELENKLLESQVKTNNSTVETNEISRKTNTYIAIFTGVAGAYYLHEFLGFIIPNICLYDKNSIVNIITIISVCAFVYHMLSGKEDRKQQPPKQDP